MNRSGYVLAGGRSSRMGRAKALLPFRGRTLACAVAREVELAAGNAVLVGDPTLCRAAAPAYTAIPDLYPGEGPLGGILTALRHAPSGWLLVAACDMPALNAPFLIGLLKAAEASSADALMPEGPSGRLEPLCAVYHSRAREPLEAAFRSGVRKITAALEGLRVLRYPVSDVRPFENVNTPEDWSGYAAQ